MLLSRGACDIVEWNKIGHYYKCLCYNFTVMSLVTRWLLVGYSWLLVVTIISIATFVLDIYFWILSMDLFLLLLLCWIFIFEYLLVLQFGFHCLNIGIFLIIKLSVLLDTFLVRPPMPFLDIRCCFLSSNGSFKSRYTARTEMLHFLPSHFTLFGFPFIWKSELSP